MIDTDYERARVVAEDLSYLMDEWRPIPDEAPLRRQTPILRRLLVEGDYARAWRDLQLPGEPYLAGPPDLEAALAGITLDYVLGAMAPLSRRVAGWFAQDGGGRIVLPISPKVVHTGDLVVPATPTATTAGLVMLIPEAEVATLGSPDAASAKHATLNRDVATRAKSLSRFLDARVGYLPGVWFSRRRLIQYAAHKLGGVHFDPTRSRKGDAVLQQLDEFAKATVTLKDGSTVGLIFLEVMSMIDALVESGDAARFRDAFARHVRTSAQG